MNFDLNYITWDNVMNTDNPNIAYNNFLETFGYIYNKNCIYSSLIIHTKKTMNG